MSTSQPSGDEGLPTTRSQPTFGFQHQVSRVSVELWFTGGLAGKAFHSGLSISSCTLSSRISTSPVRPST